jgi:protein Mpv17
LIGSPLYIIVFFSTLALWNKWSYNEFKEKVLDEGKDIYTAEWYIWPPVSILIETNHFIALNLIFKKNNLKAQFFNFYFLPTKYRLLYDSSISLGFDIYFSYVTHKHQREKKLKELNIIEEDCD